MARDTMPAVEALRTGQAVEPDFPRDLVRWAVQEPPARARLMEAEVSARIGAGRHERADERATYRDG